MEGIRNPSDLTAEYCCRLLAEYEVLDCAQLLSILRRYGGMNYSRRYKIVRTMYYGQYIRKITAFDRTYFISRPGIEIKGRIRQQIFCFWLLMDYLDRVDRHYSTGIAGCPISMEIDGRDYSIMYVERGKEMACSYQMECGGVTRYFVLVEALEQIPLIKGEQIHAFAMLDGRNTVHYYAPNQQGG